MVRTTTYLTAITKVDDQIVEVIDVEKVLSEIALQHQSFAGKLASPLLERARGREVLLVDDSNVAITQRKGTMAQLDIRCHCASDGLQAPELLKSWADAGIDDRKLLMVITDAEMPEMDNTA